MNAAFTPGPWVVHPHFAYVVPADHAERPIGGAEDDAYDLAHYAQEICALHHPDRHRSETESLANAHLIAAAPQLYEALERVTDAYGFDPSIDSSIWQEVQSALALARGEQ